MNRAVKFELYKLAKEPFLKIVFVIILIVNFVMFSGIEMTSENLIQKSFLTTIVVSLYVAFYMGNDFENGRTLYSFLSGNSRIKILLSKLTTSIIVSEILILPFPCIKTVTHSQWNTNLKITVIFCYVMLGIFLGVLGLFMACISRNAGIAVVGTIIYHMISLFLMNSEKLGFFAMKIFPVGIVKLFVEGTTQGISLMILLAWIIVLFLWAVFVIQHADI